MARRALTVALATTIITFALAGCGSSKPNYGAATMGVFMRSCDPQSAGGTREAVCRCAYERIEQQYTYDEYSRLDADLRSDPGRTLPDELMRIVAGCAVSADLSGIEGQDSSSTSESRSSSSST